MLVLVAENQQNNSYTTSLINAYKDEGNNVVCDPHNFFYSNLIPDILHIHWPERLYQWYPLSEKSDEVKVELLRERLKWYKNNGVVIVFTVHDLVLHYSADRKLDEVMFNLIIEYADIISHHCSSSVKKFTDLYPKAALKVNIINHHGDYLIDFEFIPKKEARSKLNIADDKFVILNFGSQQPYKGEGFIEKVYDSCRITSKYLLTAGNYYYRGIPFLKKIYLEMRNERRMKENFKNKKYIYRNIAIKEIPLIFNASDIVFLGHNKGLVSGIIAIAATYARPVIYPRIGCFEEQTESLNSLSYEPGNAKEAIAAILKMYERQNAKTLNSGNSEWLKKNSWKSHVELIMNAVKDYNQS
jgi:hypothetical protein